MKLGIKLLHDKEHTLVELKARVDNLNIIRKKLTNLGAQYIQTCRQIDLYFEVPKGWLKLREVEGESVAKLIYYEREKFVGPKRSDVYIVKVEKTEFLKVLLKKILKTRIVIDKVREIYQLEGTQIHLDSVKKLGTFVEFERETSADRDVSLRDLKILEELKGKLGISSDNLERASYSDIILQTQHLNP
jgi:adenylate cyclase class 2